MTMGFSLVLILIVLTIVVLSSLAEIVFLVKGSSIKDSVVAGGNELVGKMGGVVDRQARPAIGSIKSLNDV
jgi:hypothetical protein